MADLFLLISRQRLAVADLLGSLTDDEWAMPSLCTGWSVREVAAHLVMPFELGLPAMMWQMIKARGNFDRVANDFAHRAATTPTGELVSTLRANADHRFTPPGLGPQAPLTDIAVHGFDIGVPLDRRPPLPAESANEILPFLLSTKSTRGLRPKGIVDGLRFSTTDTAWSGGDGLEVSGPAASLILALTARRAGLEGLSGDGVAELARRIG